MARIKPWLKGHSVFRIWYSLYKLELQGDMVKTLERMHGFSAPLSTWQLIYDNNFEKAHHAHKVQHLDCAADHG
tara:strand:- start:195 stop:416 length:222 start_codon:yes stop_codon:yes gene_type:complete